MFRIEFVLAGNLLLIALLPRLLFRPGKFNAAWWLTAAPLLMAGGLTVAAWAGLAEPWTTAFKPARLVAAAVLAALSMAIIASAIRVHPRRISMWHQEDQQSNELVTTGPYAWVRHPLYAAFQLTLLACALGLPHPLSLVALAYGFVRFRSLARTEERRLIMSERLRVAYLEYASHTGRFIPRRRPRGARLEWNGDQWQPLKTR